MTPDLKISKECPVCKTIFISYKCQDRKVCSRACKHKRHSDLLKNGSDVLCKVCNKAFYASSSRNANYCSVNCFRHDHKAKKKSCPICKSLMPLHRTTCSKPCMALYYQTSLKGSQNPNWKGGSFSRENSGVSIRLRKLVLERDQFKCTKCGVRDWEKKPSLLHTHHIKEFSEGGPTEPDNLITLCFVCHWEDTHEYALSESMQKLAFQQGCGSYRKEACGRDSRT